MPETIERPIDVADVYVPQRVVAELLGLHSVAIRKLVAEGKIRTRSIAGSRPRYSLMDSQRLLRGN